MLFYPPSATGPSNSNTLNLVTSEQSNLLDNEAASNLEPQYLLNISHEATSSIPTMDFYVPELGSQVLPEISSPNNFPERYEISSSTPLLNYKMITNVLSPFQIHLVPTTINQKKTQYTVVILFRREFIDGPSMVGCCASCPDSKHFLRRFTPVYCSPLSYNQSVFCSHVKYAFDQVISLAGIAYDQQPMRQLALQCTEAAEKTSGFWNAGLLSGCSHKLHVHISIDSCVGLFYQVNSSWRCHLCKLSSCIHKKSVKKFPSSPDVPDTERTPENDLFSHILKSKTRYKFDDNLFWQQVLEQSKNYELFLDNNFKKKSCGNYVVTPECETCPCGQKLSLVSPSSKAIIVGNSLFCNVEIYYGWCPEQSCASQKSFHFDGKKLGIINYKDSLLMCSGLAKEYLYSYSQSGQSFFSWWRSKYHVFLDSLDSESWAKTESFFVAKRGAIAKCIAGFAELIDFPETMTHCCSSPKKITMDGIVLSVKSQRIPDFEFPWISEQVAYRATRRSDRSLEFSSLYEKSICSEFVKKRPVTMAICKSMCKANHSALALVCEIIIAKNPQKQTLTVKAPLRRFLSCFLKTVNPAIRMAPSFLTEDIQNLKEFPTTLSNESYLALYKFSPVLLDVYEEVSDTGFGTDVINSFKFFLEELLDCAKLSWEETADLREFGTLMDYNFYEEFTCKDIGNVWATGHYFPGYKVTCSLPGVSMHEEGFVPQCNKTYHEKGKCGAGLVPFWCLEHHKCLGFVVLQSAESPKLILEALITRFPKTELVMYDNACHLHEYGLNRFPRAIKDIQFMIDSLHWVNHRSCAAVYNADVFRNQIGNMSSVLSEQKNSILTHLKDTAPFLSFRSFVSMLRFSFAVMNLGQEHRNKK